MIKKAHTESASLIRVMDLIISIIAVTLLTPLLFLLFTILLTESAKPIFRQKRLGRNFVPFAMYKFRTMRLCTIQTSTHLVGSEAITPLGYWLRRYKLDELPQLINVIMGSMSLVGPRPNLRAQTEVIAARAALDLYKHKPGLTGLAQIAGVTMREPRKLAKLDSLMMKKLSVTAYLNILLSTVFMQCSRGKSVD